MSLPRKEVTFSNCFRKVQLLKFEVSVDKEVKFVLCINFISDGLARIAQYDGFPFVTKDLNPLFFDVIIKLFAELIYEKAY